MVPLPEDMCTVTSIVTISDVGDKIYDVINYTMFFVAGGSLERVF